MTWGDRFTEKEADYALDEAPTIQKDGYTFIDYKQFCSKLSGLRKPNKQALQVWEQSEYNRKYNLRECCLLFMFILNILYEIVIE